MGNRKQEYIAPEIEPGHPDYEYNLNDPLAVSEVKRFEKAFLPFVEKYGPYAFEHWCCERGLYLNCEWKNTASGHEALINSSIAGIKKEGRDSKNNPYTFTTTAPAFNQSKSLYDALIKLQGRRDYANKQNKEQLDTLLEEKQTLKEDMSIKSSLPF